MRRLREEAGQVTIEILGMLPWLLIAGLVAWQLLLVNSTANSAINAARSASRQAGRGGDYKQAARDSLPGYLRGGSDTWIDPKTGFAHVKVKMPLIVPLVHTPITIEEKAHLPNTG